MSRIYVQRRRAATTASVGSVAGAENYLAIHDRYGSRAALIRRSLCQTPPWCQWSYCPWTRKYRWERFAGINQHALKPNMPPSNFFTSLGNTNLRRTHGTSPRSSLNLDNNAKVPGQRRPQKVGATVGETAAPDKRRQLRGKKGDVLTASTRSTQDRGFAFPHIERFHYCASGSGCVRILDCQARVASSKNLAVYLLLEAEFY